MVDKGKSIRCSNDPNPDFSPRGKVGLGIAQRMSRLQLEAINHRDYPRMHKGLSLDNNLSDTCSAITSNDEPSDTCTIIVSNDTMSSMGEVREAFVIILDQVAQILQEALARQR
uniref:Uncharacterized protein n=1 Tax=Asparagus officinalis TaxID=4686 RepID=Q2AA83_ASPOF|nr:hypothetical protein 17.t00011 [Asparagus officinalis]